MKRFSIKECSMNLISIIIFLYNNKEPKTNRLIILSVVKTKQRNKARVAGEHSTTEPPVLTFS
jgi:hypothetical protein